MNTAKLPASTRIIYTTFDFFGQYWPRILFIAIVAAVLAGLSTGVFVVKKEEQGIITRFGKVVNTEVTPGLGYAIPMIEKVHIFPVKRIISKQISSNQDSSETFTVLSGDTNLLEVTFNLQYTIIDLRKYLFVVADPDLLLSRIARENLIEEFGNNFVELIFTNNRQHIEQELQVVIQDRANVLGLGIEINALSIVELSPIEETVAAFRDVNDAVAEKLQVESDAERKRQRRIARSRGQAQAIVLDAKAKAHTRRQQAKSTANIFLDLLEQYRNNPEQVAITRYWDRMRTTLQEARLTSINSVEDLVVDINMIDSVAMPVNLAMSDEPITSSESPPMDVLDRSSATLPPTPTSDHAEVDRLTMDGRTHDTESELDHLSTANARSLIFDTSALFKHAHIGRRNQILDKLSVQNIEEEDSLQTESESSEKEK